MQSWWKNLQGHAIEEITAIVEFRRNGMFQIFSADPMDYVEDLYKIRENSMVIYTEYRIDK